MEGFEYQEIKEAVKLLMVNPIEEKWQPKNLGICKAQRIDCSHMPNRTYLMCKDKNKNDVLYGYSEPVCDSPYNFHSPLLSHCSTKALA